MKIAGDYRVVCGVACYMITIDEEGKIIDSAPIAKSWRHAHINVFKRAFPKAKIEKLKEDK